MSLLPALEDSENSPGHGWNTSSRFSIETPPSGKQFGETETSSNLYHHLINQNNTGEVPDALVEEEIINDDGHAYYSDHQQQQFHMPQQQQHQQQHQLQHHPQQHQQQQKHLQQQHQLQQHQQQQQQQQKDINQMIQQQHVSQQHIYTQQQQLNQQQRLQLQMQNTKQMAQLTNTGGNVPQQKVNKLLNHLQQADAALIVSRQTMPQDQSLYQSTVHTSQNSMSQPDNVNETLQNELLTNEKAIEQNNKLLRSLGLPPVGTNQEEVNQPRVVNNCDYGGLLQTNSSQQNAGLHVQQGYSQSFDSQQRKMDINVAGNNGTFASPAGQRMVMNPSQGQQKTLFVSGGNRPNIISHSSQRVPPAKQAQSLLNPMVQGTKTTSTQQNPVQVQAVSTNQTQSMLNKPGMTKITKKNVVLEGGGQFEEGQAYVIRDRHGNSKTMVWRNGEFQTFEEKQAAIQHSTIDSSQRGRGGRGRGRGRGRGQVQGNATGVHMVQNVRGAVNNGVRLIRPNQPSALLPDALQHHPNYQQQQMRQYTPRGQILNTSRGVSPNQHQIIGVVSSQALISQGIPQKISLKNLMPAQTTKPKTAEETQAETTVATEVVDQNVPEAPIVDATPADPPNIPNDPGAVAVCQYCGTTSMDKFKCESCKRSFTSATKYVIPNKTKDGDPESKRRKLDNETTTRNITLDKSVFYNKKVNEQNEIYVKVINAATTNVRGRTPRIIRPPIPGRGRRGRGRGRGMALPETVTISSDEEECPDTLRLQSMSAPCTPSSHRSPSHNSDQSECPEPPLIPNIPVSKRNNDKTSRVKKMETPEGRNLADKTQSIQFTLNASSLRVGTFKGAPIEPILISGNGLSFYIEGVTGSHRFHLYPQEIQQCLAKLESSPYLIFFLTTHACAERTRKDLGMAHNVNRSKPPPDLYFDPTSAEMRHQMITIVMDQLDAETKQEFQNYMELFKSWGKQGDEAYFMELSTTEADEIFRQSTTLQRMSVSTPSVPMATDHGYSSQQGEEDRQSDRSPSPRIGFVGPIIKLLTYPPPPEKGGICITNEDLYCLQEGEFLNDVIIDFYLKFLLRDKLSSEDRERTHIFSSFFYKRLTQRIRGAAIDDDPRLSLPEKRHARVKTWTRHVDLFKKDFIVIPINEHAHWFLAIICFSGLEGPVENLYIPKPVSALPAEMVGVPSPPQPTEDEGEENMETEEGEIPPSNTSAKPQSSTDQSKLSTPTQESTTTDGETPSSTQCENNASQETTPENSSEKTVSQTEENGSKTDGNVSKTGENVSQTENTESQSQTEQTVSQNESGKPDEKMDTNSEESAPKTPKCAKSYITMKGIRGTPVDPTEPTPQEATSGIKQPCIIVFDSLYGPSRSRIVNVLKEYLQVEWAVKKGGKELNKSIFKGCVPKVPQQNNFSDCGVYMLQYVESFFEDPVQDFLTPMKGLHDWFTTARIEGKREELRDLIIELKEKYESKPTENS